MHILHRSGTMWKKERSLDMKLSIVINKDVLRRTRKGLELTQEYMAHSLGVTRKTYAKYESERTYLSEDTVRMIALLLNIDMKDLVLFDINKEIERIKNMSDEEFKELSRQYNHN